MSTENVPSIHPQNWPKSFVLTIAQTAFLALLALAIVLPAHAQTTREQIDSILARPGLAGNTWTMLIQNEFGTVTYYKRDSGVGQIPASNQKILTTAAAFGLLGTNHFFETRVYTNGTLVNLHEGLTQGCGNRPAKK